MNGWMDGYAGELERARALFELGIGQALLDMPELLWKAYIDFEIAEGEAARARQLYERLLERTQHVKVFISAAQFESAQGETGKAREAIVRLQGEGKTVKIITVGRKGDDMLKRLYGDLIVWKTNFVEIKQVGFEQAHEIAEDVDPGELMLTPWSTVSAP